ncbi:MAG: carboxypeptidase-like regulatory domain-containing protein, partial [Cyclobacteriaceae bacterium]|nr:carboxypeptidase-like regulatory domain-containing protein [Cyclobacteriaceae bacterium]
MKVNSLLNHFKRHLKFALFGGLLMLLNFTVLLAQDVTVSGTVISSDDDSAIPGVNVLIKGSSTGTTTDLDGKYTLSVPGSETFLIFSSVGYT